MRHVFPVSHRALRTPTADTILEPSCSRCKLVHVWSALVTLRCVLTVSAPQQQASAAQPVASTDTTGTSGASATTTASGTGATGAGADSAADNKGTSSAAAAGTDKEKKLEKKEKSDKGDWTAGCHCIIS